MFSDDETVTLHDRPALRRGPQLAVLASLVPRATVAILATLAFLSYLVTEIGPLMMQRRDVGS